VAIVEVAAAVIVRPDGAYLLAQRPEGRVYSGWWEFPGGKIEAGESPDRALARELDEELGIEVRRAYRWITRTYAYPHAEVRLHFFRVVDWTGDPRAKEHEAIRWQQPGAPVVEPMLPANAPVLAALSLPHEYAITTAETLGPEVMLERLGRRLAGGLRLVQVRDKRLSSDARAAFARSVVRLARAFGARVLVNSDLALARAAGADGVHLSARDLTALCSRPAGLLVAASCHDAQELERAMSLELDFAVLGPVKATATHPGGPILGWTRFAELTRGATIPIYGIGGLARDDLADAWEAGAHGVAMIRGAWGSV
jgi:8-oxo-dGTP diphosphatase